jgi:hypothetical protein
LIMGLLTLTQGWARARARFSVLSRVIIHDRSLRSVTRISLVDLVN